MSKYSWKNLKIQLLTSVFLSFMLAMLVFGAVFFSGNFLLKKSIYGDSFTKKMTVSQFNKLQEYVDKNSISLQNLKRLNAWSSRGDRVHLVIYKDDNLIYESYFFDSSNSDSNTEDDVPSLEDYAPSLEDSDNKYTLTLNGNVQVSAFLYYYASDAYYYLMTVLSGLVAFVVFTICFIWLINKKIAYVVLLKKELDILSSGQLNYPVTVNARDELGELALGIDQMRLSILKYQEIERQMRSANSELITAMSHDLRTPLTSLLAYLEIIERKKYSSEEQFQELVHKSLSQTMRIKNMADKLFEYFLAYDTEWNDAEMERVDADELFGQILGDYAYSLESRELAVEVDFMPVSAEVEVNIELLQRVMDNLYSNLLKYADPLEKIEISYMPKDDQLLLTISNAVQKECEKRESTRIGVTTCRRIIEFHKGCFSTQEESDCFTVTISLPLKK